jgi:hypothetical protein
MHTSRSRFRFRSFLIFATTASALMSVNACTLSADRPAAGGKGDNYSFFHIFDENPPATAIPTKLMTVGRVLNTFSSGGSIDFEYQWQPSGFYYTQARVASVDTLGYGGNLVFYTKPADGSNATSSGGAGSDTSTERMRITSDGNVGIGTTTPASTLSINGFAQLKIYAGSPPAACGANYDGAIAATSHYTTCICNGGTGNWVLTADGSTACSW